MVVVLTALISYGVTSWYFGTQCGGHTCSQWLTSGLLRPLMSSALSIAGVTALLLPFPARIFKLWLLFVCSWGLPLSIYMVGSINIYSSHVFAISRGEAAVFLGYIFGAITLLFIAIVYLIDWWKGRSKV